MYEKGLEMNWIFGDDVDTDVIIPARYLNTNDPKELATHCMEDIEKEFASSVKKDDFIIAGYNFGCGSSREHAPLAIKSCGIRAVIAKTFARIFYRNSINIGLVIIENDKIQDEVNKDDVLELSLDQGKIINKTQNKEYYFSPYPEEIQNMINVGGLVEYTKLKRGK